MLGIVRCRLCGSHGGRCAIRAQRETCCNAFKSGTGKTSPLNIINVDPLLGLCAGTGTVTDNPSQAIGCVARRVSPKQRHTQWRFTRSALLQNVGQEKTCRGCRVGHQQDTLVAYITSTKVAIEKDAVRVKTRAWTSHILPLQLQRQHRSSSGDARYGSTRRISPGRGPVSKARPPTRSTASCLLLRPRPTKASAERQSMYSKNAINRVLADTSVCSQYQAMQTRQMQREEIIS